MNEVHYCQAQESQEQFSYFSTPKHKSGEERIMIFLVQPVTDNFNFDHIQKTYEIRGNGQKSRMVLFSANTARKI